MISLESWLQSLLWESTLDFHSSSPAHSALKDSFAIHRTKGRILTMSGTAKMIQGVREVFELVDVDPSNTPTATPDEDATPQRGKLVLIGRGLSDLPVEESLRSVLGL